MIRATFDTNILVRMVLTRPTTLVGKLHRALEDGVFTLVLSPALLSEVEETLRSSELRPRHWRGEEAIERFMARIKVIASVTPGTIEIDVPALPQRDPDDLMVLAAAVEGGAGFLVTQDKDLLSLEVWQDVRIVEPPEFYEALRLSREESGLGAPD